MRKKLKVRAAELKLPRRKEVEKTNERAIERRVSKDQARPVGGTLRLIAHKRDSSR